MFNVDQHPLHAPPRLRRVVTLSDNWPSSHSEGQPLVADVTYQVFVSWANREMTDRTSTDSLVVAEYALAELVARKDLEREGARQIQLTKVLRPQSPSSNRDFAAGLALRVYVRWPGQKTSDRSSTDSAAVAKLAFDKLAAQRASLANDGALAIVLSKGKEQLEYLDLTVPTGGRLN